LRVMSKNTLLSKLRGNTRTFVVHSSTSPYAAAAAMGAAAGRSGEFGPYFHFSTKLTPTIQRDSAADAIRELPLSNLKADFQGDWVKFLREVGMPERGLKFDGSRTPEQNTMRYLNARRRIPIPTQRVVHESRELSVPQEYKQDYFALKALINAGGDLRPYLSHDIPKKKRPHKYKNDLLLNAWGIQHLHFRPKGTGHILLCRITGEEVFVIQTLPHDRRKRDVWVETRLLQILHDNWPGQIALGKLHGIPGEVVPRDQRIGLRDHNANFTTAMTDGTVYLAPGGGLMASGECCDDRTNCYKIFSELARWQEIAVSNATSIRAALNWPPSEELSIKMMFEGRECCLYEPTTGKRLSLNLETEGPRALQEG